MEDDKYYYITMFYSLIDSFIKEDLKKEFKRAVDQKFDPSVTDGNCDELIEAGCFSDGTILFDLQNMAYVLYDAIKSGKRFGAIINKSRMEESPDPDKPWMTWHSVMCIPVKGES